MNENIEVTGADCCQYCIHFTEDLYESSGRCELLNRHVNTTDICSEYKE